MLKAPVSAAGEAMPAAILNRRAILTGTAATAAALAATTIPAEPASVAVRIDEHIHALMSIVGKEAPRRVRYLCRKGRMGPTGGLRLRQQRGWRRDPGNALQPL